MGRKELKSKRGDEKTGLCQVCRSIGVLCSPFATDRTTAPVLTVSLYSTPDNLLTHFISCITHPEKDEQQSQRGSAMRFLR